MKKMKNKEKITYKDLSTWLKVLVIYGFFSLVLDAILFFSGFLLGLTS